MNCCKLTKEIIKFSLKYLQDGKEEGKEKVDVVGLITKIFDKNFFKQIVKDVEEKISGRKCGFNVNSMGVETSNVGIENYEIFSLISIFLKLDNAEIIDRIAESGYLSLMMVIFF